MCVHMAVCAYENADVGSTIMTAAAGQLTVVATMAQQAL